MNIFKSGDPMQIKRSNGTWNNGKIVKVDAIKKEYMCQFGENVKYIPFGQAGNFLRPIRPYGIMNESFKTRAVPKFSARDSSIAHKEGDVVEILRSNGEWQEATIIKVDTNDRYYACQWSDGSKKIAFHMVSSHIRSPLYRSISGLKFLSQEDTSSKEVLEQYKNDVRELEMAVANLTLKLDRTVSSNDYSRAANIQASLESNQIKLRHARRQFEEAKKAFSGLKQFNAKKERLAHKVKSLESHCNSLSSTMSDYVTHEDYQSASNIQKLLKDKQTELLSARRQLEAESEMSNKIYKANESQGIHKIQILEKKISKLTKELVECFHSKDSIKASQLQKRISHLEAELSQTRQDLAIRSSHIR